MISPEFSTAVTLLLYGSASVAGIAGIAARKPLWRRIGCSLAVAGFACQTLMLFLGFHKTLPGGLSAGAYFQLMAWFVVLCGIAAWAKLRQEIPLVFAAPLARSLSLEQPYLPALIVLESFGMAMLTFYNSVLSVDYKYKEYLVLSLVYAVAGIGGSVLLILDRKSVV